MASPDWYDPKLYRRKKTPPEHVGVISRTKPKRFRLVRPYQAPFKLNPFWTVMLLAVLFVVIVTIAKRF